MSSKLKFEFSPAEEKPRRKFIRKSKYDPIIDQFMERDDMLVTVYVEGKKPSYIRFVLDKRIKLRGLKNEIKAFTINGVLYMEKAK